jgi:enoyl-CoA hydratase/carnithine racemase
MHLFSSSFISLSNHIKEWESDGKTELVIIKSTSSKAFCAGGDIKGNVNDELEINKFLYSFLAILAKTSDGEKLRRDFFREEYKLNYLTGNYKLPYIAIISGITMGGVSKFRFNFR